MNQPENEKYFVDYYEHLKAEKKAQSTINTYADYLKRLKIYLNANDLFLENVKEKNLFEFEKEYRDSPIKNRGSDKKSGSALNSMVTILSEFFTFLTDDIGLYKINPAKNLKKQIRYNVDRSVPTPMDEEKVKKLISSLKFDTHKNAKMSLFIHLCLDTGIKVRDVIRIKFSDIDLNNDLVLGDSRKTVIRLSPEVIEALEKYKKTFGPKGIGSIKHVFYKDRTPHKTINHEDLGTWNKYINEWAGFSGKDRVSPQDLRLKYEMRIVKRVCEKVDRFDLEAFLRIAKEKQIEYMNLASKGN